MRKMGGLMKYMPVTGTTFIVGALALSGFPLVTAGFYSKDEILWSAYAGFGGGTVLWAVGAVTAVLTAFYMFRQVGLTFFGKPRFDSHHVHPHESPSSMTLPLVVLAVLSICGGWLGIPHVLGEPLHLPHILDHYFEGFFARAPMAEEHYGAGLELGLMGAVSAGALIAMFAAYRLFSGDLKSATRMGERFSGVRMLLANKYYIDELYNAVIIAPIHWIARNILWKFVDVGIIDGTVNLVGGVARWLGGALRLTQNGVIENYAVGIVVGAVAIFWWLVF